MPKRIRSLTTPSAPAAQTPLLGEEGSFRNNILELHGEAGARWLSDLSAKVKQCERRWHLRVMAPFASSYSYVAPAFRKDGVEVVLKLAPPNPELVTEIAALRVFDSQACVKLLEADETDGVLLLERLTPGVALSTLDDEDESVAVAALVMRDLWKPAPCTHPFPSVARWASGLRRLREKFDGGTGPFPQKLVEAAEILFEELITSAAEPKVLHGDLHHDNILSADRRPWLAIDPKGVVGEPAYEVGAFLRNPMARLLKEPALHRLLARRIERFADHLALDRRRIAGWAFAQAVLSAWWSFEDHGHGWEAGLVCASALASMV